MRAAAAVDSEALGASHLVIFQSVLALSSHFPNGELVETLTAVHTRNESRGALIQSLLMRK